MDLFNRYVRLFGCFAFALIGSTALHASTASGFSYETSVDKVSRSINVVGQKGGNIYKTSIRPTPSILKSALSSRALRGGAVGILLFAGTYYGMTYNQDDGTFTKKAEQNQWEWCYIGVCSSNGSVIGSSVLSKLNDTWSGLYSYSGLTYLISASGVLNIYANKENLTNGYKTESELVNTLGGKPSTSPSEPEIIQSEVFAEALLNDAFAIEGSEYYPSEEQRNKATDALLDFSVHDKNR